MAEFEVAPVPPGLGRMSVDSNANCVNVLCGHKFPVSGPSNVQFPGDHVSLPIARVGALPGGTVISAPRST